MKTAKDQSGLADGPGLVPTGPRTAVLVQSWKDCSPSPVLQKLNQSSPSPSPQSFQKRKKDRTRPDCATLLRFPTGQRTLTCRTSQKHVWTCLTLIQLGCWIFQFQNGYRIVFFQISQFSLCQKICLMVLQYSLDYSDFSAFLEAGLTSQSKKTQKHWSR